MNGLMTASGPGVATAASSWTAPVVVASAGVAAWAYAVGMRRLRQSNRRTGIVPTRRVVAFGAGLAAILAALTSPLGSLSHDLLSAHMGQHLLLTVVAAPLLMLGAPALPLTLALRVRWRQRMHRLGAAPAFGTVRRIITQPITVWLLQFLALWTWHAPALYEAAVGSEVLHAVEHATFLGTAVLFWWVVIGAVPGGRRRMSPGHDVLYVVIAGIQGSVLGALLTFASSPLYRVYVERAAIHGVAPLDDQQVAGLVMWIPASVVYVGAAAIFFVRWLREVEERARGEDELTSLAVATK